MADGNLVHQPQNGKSAMVFGPNIYNVPLLPFETELIKTIGITEEEYQLFAAEVRRRGRLRPTEYEHIPDIVCEPATTTAILVNLAISLVLTGVAYLLTPKPKMPGAQKSRGGSVVDLGDVTGASRFTPSRGFETLAELANYAAPIPLIFGRYEKSRGEESGGMLTTPKLVWSRMFSHGTYQRAKMLFVVGEQGLKNGLDSEEYSNNPSGLTKPDLQGIFLGNNALDPIFDDFFAFYWKPNSDFSIRISNGDLVYGTAGGSASGDPDASGINRKGEGKEEEVFLCPTKDEDRVSAFCHAYSPANRTGFGTYAPIANGTSYRLNYKIVSIFPPEDGREDKSKEVKRLRLQTLSRIKIAGDQNLFKDEKKGYGSKGSGATELYDEVRKQNQRSLGRNYSPRMGIVKLIRGEGGTEYTTDSKKLTRTDSVFEGDTIIYKISASSISDDYYHNAKGKGESVGDINASVESMQLAADDAMQLGEKFSIAGSTWKVTKRSQVRFDATAKNAKGGSADQKITLECIDTSRSITSRIGIVSADLVVNPSHVDRDNDDSTYGEYIGDSQPGGVDEDGESIGQQGVGEGFFPLTRVETAIVTNNRPAVVTEIGIKSNVYQRLNGLCAFTGLPDAKTLNDYEEDRAQVNSGTITSSILRASVFRVFIKRAGTAAEKKNISRPLQFNQKELSGDMYFVVRGSRPVAQYNFIRIIGFESTELEFEFVPASGAELRLISETTQILELAASTSFTTTYPAKVAGLSDDFKIQAACKQIAKGDIAANKEFFRDASKTKGDDPKDQVSSIARARVYPDPIRQKGLEEGNGTLERVSNIANLDVAAGKMGAFGYDILDDADGFNVGKTKIVRTQEIIENTPYRWVSLKWKFRVAELPVDHFARSTSPSAKRTWVVDEVSVISSVGIFGKDEIIQIKRGAQSTEAGSAKADYGNDNPFIEPLGPSNKMRWSGREFRITATRTIDVIGGRSQGYYYELFGSARKAGEGETETVDITETGANNKSITFSLKAKVKKKPTGEGDPDNFTGIQNFLWEVVRMNVSSSTVDWVEGEEFTHTTTISSDNPFRSVYDASGAVYRIAGLAIPEGATPTTYDHPESAFAQQTQYADISMYREFVEKSNSNEPEHQIVYVNEIQENNIGPREKSPSPRFSDLTLAGLSLKAGRSFSQLDQLRCWVSEGIQVERLHPQLASAYGDTNPVGASNLFTDLVYYLFTDQVGGAGALLSMTRDNAPLIDKDAMAKTSRFLRRNRLFFNGPIVERTNLRQFVMDLAPNFLCNFVISDGKFSLKPAVPAAANGNILADRVVTISQLFTTGNILEDTYKIEYLRSEERRPFKAIVRYRQERQNKLPEEKTVSVRGYGPTFDLGTHRNVDLLPTEQFDLTQFCTSEHHAVLVGKYFLSLRRLVTHTISFSTTVHGLNLSAGSYIKVITESSPYSSANNGTISSNGAVTSVTPLRDKSYNVVFFKSGSEDVRSGVMQVSNGFVRDSKFHDSVFTITTRKESQNVYVVEQLTFSQEGTVDIVASEHPCNKDGTSKLAGLLSEDGASNFEVFD